MSLAGFQRGLCALIASPPLCREVRRDGSRLPAAWDLTPRERRRLVAIAAHRGMAANCTIYRANRLTPLWNLLPRTCFLLGEKLHSELDRYWGGASVADLQFGSEIRLFAAHLRAPTTCRRLGIPHLREILAYEVAMQELPLLASGPGPAVLCAEDAATRALLRALRFTREPGALLKRIDERQKPPYGDLPAGEFWLLLDARGEELRHARLPVDAGRTLARLCAGRRVGRRAMARLQELGLAGEAPPEAP
jgi:hypothetical protein